MDLIIVGASGFGREVLQIVKDINKKQFTWNILGFLDDNLKALEGYSCDYEVIGTIKDWKPKEDLINSILMGGPTRVEAKDAIYVGIYSGLAGQSNRDQLAATNCGIDYIDLGILLNNMY